MYLVLLLVIIPVLWYLYTRGRERLDFPGPPGLPILGNILSIDVAWTHVIYADWAKKYGKIFKINMLGQEILIVRDIQLFNELLVKKGSESAGRPEMYETWFTLGGSGNDIIFSAPNAIWRRLRKITHSSLRMFDTGLEKIDKVSMEAITIMLEDLQSHKGRAVDPKEILHFTTMNIFATFLVGRTYDKGSSYQRAFMDLEAAWYRITGLRHRGAIADVFPFLQKYINFIGREKYIFEEVLMKMSKIVIEDSKAEEEKGNINISSMLRRCVAEGEITEKQCRHVIADLIIAGSVTTTTSMYAFINIMIHNKQVQRKLQEESDRVLGSRMVTLKDRELLPYHMATLQELLRYSSIVGSYGVPHKVITETEVMGRRVPQGTFIFFDHFGVNHCEENFPGPHEFKPERFLDEEGNFVPADHPNRRNMNPFGAGPRVCVGENLAKARLFLFITSLLQRFDVVEDEESPMVSCDPRKNPWAALIQFQPYKARFLERK